MGRAVETAQTASRVVQLPLITDLRPVLQFWEYSMEVVSIIGSYRHVEYGFFERLLYAMSVMCLINKTFL
jgi:hypothetical protein